MTSQRFKWFRSVNCFQANWALAHLFKADNKSHYSCQWRVFRLYLNVIEKLLSVKSLVFWQKNEKRHEIEFWTFDWTCYTLNKCNMERKQHFSDTAKIQQYANSITSTLVQ